jgi:hypothetical protein
MRKEPQMIRAVGCWAGRDEGLGGGVLLTRGSMALQCDFHWVPTGNDAMMMCLEGMTLRIEGENVHTVVLYDWQLEKRVHA